MKPSHVALVLLHKTLARQFVSAFMNGFWYLLTNRILPVLVFVLLSELVCTCCSVAKRHKDQRERDQLNAAFRCPAFGEDAGPTPHRPPTDEHGTGTASD